MPRDRDDSERLMAAVADAVRRKRPLSICGRGSKTFLGQPATGDILAVADHCGIVDYRSDELVVIARAGTPLTELRRVLAAQQQMLAFDPPTFSGDGSLGGAVAAGLSGPGRPWYGALRDAVLGVTLIDGRGDRLKFGGAVMKNVAGYDVSRLMAGAFGSLGVLLEVSVRVVPCPQFTATRVFAMDRATAHANVIAWARTALPLSATCHFESLLHVRLSGTERSVRAAATRIGGEEVAHAAEFWDAVRDRTHPFFGGGRALRIALPPAAAYPRLDGAWLTEWGGSLRWLRTELPVDRVTAALRPLGGHVLTGRGANARQLPDGGALKYLRRLKDCFDPGAIFNRGLLFQEISEG